jgi:hypothetical protein
MVRKRTIHTTLDLETYEYIKRIQDIHNLNLNTTIKLLVDKNKECKKRLEKKMFKEVIDHVIELYINSEYFSKN